MIPVYAKVGFCALGALCIAGRKANARRRTPAPGRPATRRGQQCESMPWLPEDVTQVMADAWAAGVQDPHVMAVDALRAVYPNAPDGQPLTWPAMATDCVEKRSLSDRVHFRAERIVAEGLDVGADTIWFEAGGY